MTAGKNKKKFKTKGKKKIDPQTRKEWFDIKAPTPFEIKPFGKTCINRTSGTKIATEELKGRVIECYLSDLKKNADNMHWRKIKLITEDVEGKNCRTSFYGLDMTRDKLCQFIRKWQSMVEAHVDVKTQDGYFLRLFIIGFTNKQKDQIKKTSYAVRSQIKTIRKRMVQVVTEEAQQNTLTKFIQSLIGTEIGDKIVEKCKFIYPLQNVMVKKVKMLKKPKFDITKLNELYNEAKRGAEEKSGDNKKDDDKEVENLLKK